MELKSFLSLFFLENPRYILEPDVSEIVQRSSEWATSDEIKNLIEDDKLPEKALPEHEYLEILREAGWFGDTKLPRYKMKEKVINLLYEISSVVNRKETLSVEAEILKELIDLIKKYNKQNYYYISKSYDKGFLKEPDILYYDSRIKKKLQLKYRIYFNEFLMFLKRKNIIKIENDTTGTNYSIYLYPNDLKIEFKIGHYVKEKVETLLQNNKNPQTFQTDLEKLTYCLKLELEKTINHINWLEETIDSPTQIFEKEKSNKQKNQKITTRKLAVSNSN